MYKHISPRRWKEKLQTNKYTYFRLPIWFFGIIVDFSIVTLNILFIIRHCRSTVVDQRVQCKCKRYNVRMSVVTDLPHENSFTANRSATVGMQARIQKFFKGGGGVEEENFERKMFVDTPINACTHKYSTNLQLFPSFSFSRGLSSYFCFVLLL